MQTKTTANTHTIKDLSRIAAENNGTEIAFGDGLTGEEITWAEFDVRSCRAANGFREYAAQGDRIVFLCEGSTDHVTLWNGALQAGCVVSNVHTRGSPETIRYCIDELSPQVIVLDESFAEQYHEEIANRLSTEVSHVVVIGDETALGESMASFLSDRSETRPDANVSERDVAAVIWTSGTTGRPKGWCFTNRGLLDRGMKILSTGSRANNPRRLQGLTPSFAAWYSATIPALLSRATTYFLPDWEPERYLELIEEKKITRLTLVPTMWQELLRTDTFDEYDVSSLEVIGAAGERLTEETLAALREHVCDQVVNSYSATEAVATSILHDGENQERVGSVGKPTPLTDIRVVTPDGSPNDTVPRGETGELIVRTTDHPIWVWDDTEKTHDAFVDGWWYSGDLGYKDEDGYLYLKGRKDFTIMSKGIKVHPGPLEERLDDHPAVDESAVIGVEDDEFGEKVTAVVSTADSSVTPGDLDQWCLDDDGIARFERPREYKVVEDPLPKTVTGKLDRESIKERILR